MTNANETLTAAARAAYEVWTAAADQHKALSQVGVNATRAQLTASYGAMQAARAAYRAADDAREEAGAPE